MSPSVAGEGAIGNSHCALKVGDAVADTCMVADESAVDDGRYGTRCAPVGDAAPYKTGLIAREGAIEDRQ
jgi:hypothetical protein